MLLMMVLPWKAVGQSTTTYSTGTLPSGWSASGGSMTMNSISWTYSSATYLGLNSGKIQIGSKNNPQTSNWTIQTAISNFGTGKKVTEVSLTAYTTATTATYDISVGGTSVKSGSLTTSSATYTASSLSATSGDVVITMTGSNSSKAMYLSSISVTYEVATPTPTTYTVSFDCDGGEGCPDDVTGIEPGENNFTVPSATPTKLCYTFDGFYYDEDENMYEPGETYTITGNLELTASWTLNKYDVTYQAGEGSGSNYVDANQNCGSSYTIKAPATVSITAPAAKPYFTGWLGSDDNTYQTGDTYEVSAALTLTAQWTATAVYDVLYDCNGGTANCPSDASYEENTTIQLPAAPTYADHTFNGWLCSADLETYAAGADYTITEDVEFEAQWLENLAAPTITVEGVSTGAANTYYATAAITITAASGATIYYTTDGTNPTTGSTVYSASFNVTTTGENTVKAIAVKAGNGNSSVSSSTFTIVQPNEATFTGGVYASLNTESDYNNWYKYNKTGDQVWSWSSYNSDYFAKITGYYNNTNYANEDWLISPKMSVENSKLAISFDCAARYGNSYESSAWYSTNYPGYGDPTSYTWTKLQDLPYNNNFVFTSQTMNITGVSSDVYFAIKYTCGTSNASTLEVKNFSAKQCYPVTYNANYDNPTGTTTDANSPYAVGAEVTILDCGFDAPDNTKEFTKWNTQADGLGTDKNPGQKITMTTAGYELYAIWGDKCIQAAVMNATTGEAVYDYNSGEKRFNINLSSSVKAHGGCDIYDYGFVYSTTVANPTIGADNCTKVMVGETQPDVDDPFETTLINVTKEATYYIRSYATNAAGTAYSDVINIAVPANFPTWSISYTTNGEDEATTTTIYKGAPISGLLAAPEQDVPEGYTFMGWYGDDYALNNTAPTFVKDGDAINSNLALKAVFALGSVAGEGTVVLTNTTIQNSREGKTSYGTYTIGDWSGKFMINKNGEVYSLQLGYNTSSSASAYNSHLTTPECAYNITSITIATNNNTASGRTFYLCNADNLGTASSGTYGSGSTTAANGSVTINVSGNTKQFHIYPNGTAYIESISLAYSEYSYNSYCTSVSTQAAISGTIIEGHLTTDGTIAAGTAVCLTSPITINSGKKLTVYGALGNDNPANLIIEDGAQLILQDGNTAVAATVKKEIHYGVVESKGAAEYWYAISSSVNNPEITTRTNLITGTESPNRYDLYRYDEENSTWENYKADHEDFTTLENGRGYLYRNESDMAITYTGNVNTSAKYTVTAENGGRYNGFNLIGNPYTHVIYKGGAFANSVANGYTLANGYYRLKTDGEWEAGADNVDAINPNEGFLVEAINGGEITIYNTTATTRYNNDYLRFTVANGDYEDVAYAMFDKGVGLSKINHRNANIPMLYINQNGTDYAIATMDDDIKSFNLNFKAMTMGKYTLSYKANGEYNYLHVINRITGEDVDMLLEGEYTFVATPNDNDSRFIVRLSYLPDYSEGADDVFAYQNGNDILVSGEGELQIFDVTGRNVMTTTINGAETINVSAKGVYIFRLVGTEIKTQKIVIR